METSLVVNYPTPRTVLIAVMAVVIFFGVFLVITTGSVQRQLSNTASVRMGEPAPARQLTLPVPSMTALRNDSIGSLDMVLAFPRMTDKDMAKIGGYFKYSTAKLKERDLEFVDSIRRNLQHPVISSIHIFNDKPDEIVKLLKNEHGIDLSKANMVKSSKDVTYAELFDYVSNYLQERFVIIINADMFLGEGFTNLDWSYLKHTRVMYSLTRKHLKPIPEGCGYNEKSLISYCEQGSKYTGAHDCFLFYVNSQLPDRFLNEVKHKLNALGMENVLIWAFKEILHFTVLNPCKILSIHHNHCSNVRPSPRKYRARVDVNGNSGRAPISNSLYGTPEIQTGTREKD